MTLYINTKDQKTIKVSLRRKGQIVESLSKDNEYGSQVLLPLIDKMLKDNKLKYEDLEKIEVETGPGSFTGLRVGVSVANALGFALKIPVNSKKMETKLQY